MAAVVPHGGLGKKTEGELPPSSMVARMQSSIGLRARFEPSRSDAVPTIANTCFAGHDQEEVA
jgi:hypothetical protein